MVDTFKTKILKFFARDYFKYLENESARLKQVERELDHRVNRRVADTIAKMDPYEPLLKEFHGIFSEEFEKVEENLNEASRISMGMWAFGQKNDPHLKRMIEWVMNNAGNEVLKRAPISVERTQYGRAQIANMILFRREIGRLASIYEEVLRKGRDEDFESEKSVDY